MTFDKSKRIASRWINLELSAPTILKKDVFIRVPNLKIIVLENRIMLKVPRDLVLDSLRELYCLVVIKNLKIKKVSITNSYKLK